MGEVIRSARKIGLHHFAFWRGHLEGIDLVDLGKLYLETGADRVRAKETLRWLRNELIAAARRQAQPAIARLLRVPLEKIPGSVNDSEAPSSASDMDLETFRVERDPDGFYSEKELIELFEAEMNRGDPVAARKAARNDRLRKRLRDATAWLENFLCVEPLREDPLAGWLDETIANRLSAAGLLTIQDLLDLIERRGKHWHRKIAKLGPIGAMRLQAWLAKYSFIQNESVAVPIRTFVAPSMSIVPLERFRPSDELSGAVGLNRAYSTAMNASNDRDAIEAWLASLSPKRHTVRNYRKEAERFLLWCIFELGKPMSSAVVEDCIAYRNFLNDLGRTGEVWFWKVARERWVGKDRVPRWSKDWRPFFGALALTSQRQAVTILTIMFEFLRRQRYLETNPWSAVPPLLTTIPTIRKDHSLSAKQWAAVLSTLDKAETRDEAWYRLRFALMLGYSTGLRLEEMATSVVSQHTAKPGEPNPGLKPAEDGDGLDLEVVGKGMKLRTVPMANAVMDCLSDYMEVRGLGRNPDDWPPGTSLLATLPRGMQYVSSERTQLSVSAIFRMFKAHFLEASRQMSSLRDAEHLKQASTHWMRHTHATHSLEAGATIKDVQEMLGHESPATTSIYLHSSRKRKKAAVEKLTGGKEAPLLPGVETGEL